MRKITSKQEKSSRVTYDLLEEMVRVKVGEFIQDILNEEIAEFLGRGKSERITVIDIPRIYRNGKGKHRRLALMNGTVTIRRPRLRNLTGFESRVLPLFKRRTKELGEMLPELYLHGLANGDFELALRGLLGEGAPQYGARCQVLTIDSIFLTSSANSLFKEGDGSIYLYFLPSLAALLALSLLQLYILLQLPL